MAHRLQTDRRAEGKPRKHGWQPELPVQPIECGTHIIDLAPPVVVLAMAQAGSAKVKAQRRESEPIQRFHGMKHHLVVECAPINWMRVADQRRVGGILGAKVQNGFKLSSRSIEKQRANCSRPGVHGD